MSRDKFRADPLKTVAVQKEQKEQTHSHSRFCYGFVVEPSLRLLLTSVMKY